MTCHLVTLCFDANDPLRLARFWATVLGWEMADEPEGGFALLPSDDTGFRIEFFPTQESTDPTCDGKSEEVAFGVRVQRRRAE